MSAFQLKCSKHKHNYFKVSVVCDLIPERLRKRSNNHLLRLEKTSTLHCLCEDTAVEFLMTCQHRVVLLWFCHMHYFKMESILQIVPVLWGRTHRSTLCVAFLLYLHGKTMCPSANFFFTSMSLRCVTEYHAPYLTKPCSRKSGPIPFGILIFNG